MNQLSLDDFSLFIEIAAAGSLSTVARARNVVPSRISRALARIEAECALRLVHRSTHGLSLTDDGALFLDHARRVVEAQRQLQDELSDRSRSVSGRVCIGVGQLLAEHVLIPQLARLRVMHPRLSVDLHIDDRMASLAGEGIDIAVRAGVPPADTMIVRPLGTHGRALYAAPGYLDTHGTPRTPADLDDHTLISNLAAPQHNRWAFVIDGAPLTREVDGQVRANSSAAVVSLALAGAGIARLNDVLATAMVAQGRLRPVLGSYMAPSRHPIYAAILAERDRAPKIRATMDFLQRCFSDFMGEAAHAP
ncbi:LysR family transcriptional regulator [Denitromonas iodatirespirans]|uniref:LysR family transcriptional regulator n=1 Tax=Denitromonas iodatirespirans TaxID=2795389 RepID=A0A944DGP0_DENI1|nr:LysR family transcriptional regulator [Denitromonas iodatirespirans]MBT0963857.1 LysR family transcriptional regulator [Denitromonas iodatirespirans]